MAESPTLLYAPKVKDLISIYERQNSTTAETLAKPSRRSRAKSLGNILSKKLFNSNISFNDIERNLSDIETYLQHYNVYNKNSHVAVQEELFSILTSIVNFDGRSENDGSKKRELIRETQRLVSILNSKLPHESSEGNHINANGAPENAKYVPYSEHIKLNGKQEENKFINGNWKSSSVSNLKANFETISHDSPTQNDSIEKSKTRLNNYVEIKKEKQSSDDVKLQNTQAENVVRKEIKEAEEVKEPTNHRVSVSHLRSLFEGNIKENPKGLEIIVKPTAKSFHTSMANIPYIEGNLGNVRMERRISGNYMSYSGLLRNTEINRSKSTNDINRQESEEIEDTEESNNNIELESLTYSENESDTSKTLTDDEETFEEQEVEAQVTESIEIPTGYSIVTYEPKTEHITISNPNVEFSQNKNEESVTEQIINLEENYENDRTEQENNEPETEKVIVTNPAQKESISVQTRKPELNVETNENEEDSYSYLEAGPLSCTFSTYSDRDSFIETDEEFEDAKSIEELNEEFERVMKENAVIIEDLGGTKV